MVVSAAEFDADDLSMVSLFSLQEIVAFQARLPCSLLGSVMGTIPSTMVRSDLPLNRMRVAERPQMMEESGQVVCVYVTQVRFRATERMFQPS